MSVRFIVSHLFLMGTGKRARSVKGGGGRRRRRQTSESKLRGIKGCLN
jgi:hypothetical protein